IISENLYDKELVSSSTEGFEQLKAKAARYSFDYVEKITGIKEDKIRETARLISQNKKVCILVSSGLGIISDDEKLAQAVANLAMLTGMVGRKGSGIGFLGEKCNSQGTLDMGALPHLLPGFEEVSDEKARNAFEEAWKTSIPSQPGQSALEMFEGAEKGSINALYLVGENPVVSYPDTAQTIKALESLDFLVVQDLFLTPTAKCADVVLPAASFAEKSGTYTNFERRVQKLNCGLNRLEGVKTDLEIFVELSLKMGYEMNTSTPDEVMKEIGTLVPLYTEVNYSRLGEEGIVWGSPNGGKETTLYGEKLSKVKARFIPVEVDERVLESDKDYPLLLLIGSVLFHSGSLSSKSPELNQLDPGGWVEMSLEDARDYQLTDRQPVFVRSKRGEIALKV
ncbi:MAG: molybdopterin-dependent oxidoreductase, partial [Deltaproteobacteria bacterium]|nr:molybdopterin-dependent oxidoreductase [Deltaproteobacteria bacterium]